MPEDRHPKIVMRLLDKLGNKDSWTKRVGKLLKKFKIPVSEANDSTLTIEQWKERLRKAAHAKQKLWLLTTLKNQTKSRVQYD